MQPAFPATEKPETPSGRAVRPTLMSHTSWNLVIPAVFYFCAFAILTYPLIFRFNSGFFCDEGDGLQNIWNIWWVHKAVVELHSSPLFTSYLHFPNGVTLLGHTLNLFNGLVCLALLPFMSLMHAHNCIVVFSFVMSGITAFWLSREFTNNYVAALLGGFIFTFSEFHFAHAQGHLQLVSMEWMPLAVLWVYRLIQRPTMGAALLAAGVAFLTLLCDYYYFMYVLMIGGIMVVAHFWRHRSWRHFFGLPNIGAFLIFAFATFATSGVYAGALALSNRRDPMTGQHSLRAYSMDLLSPIIPSRHWIFGHLTRGFWGRLLGDSNETSVYVGIALLILCAIAVLGRRATRDAGAVWLWVAAATVSFLLALGPILRIGNVETHVPMPYAALYMAIPLIRLSGMPIRFMAAFMLAAAVLAAIGGTLLLNRKSMLSRAAQLGLLALLLFDTLPAPIPVSLPAVPEYVTALQAIPGNAPVIDHVSNTWLSLYYQTIHQKPMAFGYISRVPQSVVTADDAITQLLDAGKYHELRQQFGFEYLVETPNRQSAELELVSAGETASLYRIR
jgi:hypothetical protein